MEETNKYQQIWELLDEVTQSRPFLERLTDLSWILLLKYLSDYDSIMEKEAQQHTEVYLPILAENYRWSNWVPNLLNRFSISGNNKISTYILDYEFRLSLRHHLTLLTDYLLLRDHSNIKQTLGDAFKHVLLCIDNAPTNLQMILHIVNTIDIHESEARTAIRSLYENVLQKLEINDIVARDCFTPRALVHFMLNLCNPQISQKIYDPACGTGTFLLEAYQYLHRTSAINGAPLQENVIYGNVLDDTSALICATNMALRTQSIPQLYYNETLEYSFPLLMKEKFDCILSNPPFGRFKENEIRDDKIFLQSGNNEPLFLHHCIRNLKSGGLGAIIVSDTALTKQAKDFVAMRRTLLQQCKLTTVVYLPNNTFNINVYTAILFLTKAEEIQEHCPSFKKTYATDEILYLAPIKETCSLELYLNAASQAVENYQQGRTISTDLVLVHWTKHFDETLFQQKRFCLEKRFASPIYEQLQSPLVLIEQIMEIKEQFAILVDDSQFPSAFSTVLLTKKCQIFDQVLAKFYNDVAL